MLYGEEMKNQFPNLELAQQYLDKLVDLKQIPENIRETLSQSSKGRITGVSLFIILQLLELEKKTCLLQISSKSGQGFLYFFSGQLVDALSDEYEGEQAVYEILRWDNVEIEIMEMVRKEQNRMNINKSLPSILMEAIRLKSANDKDKQSNQLIESLEKTPNNQTEFSENSNIIQKEIKMGNINECLNELMKVDGAMAASVVDAKSGMALGTIGSGFNLEIAAAGNSEVVKSKLKTMQNLGLKDKIEDILITLGQQYHLIRPLSSAPSLFIYFVLNRAQSNLAMARYKLGELEGRLEL